MSASAHAHFVNNHRLSSIRETTDTQLWNTRIDDGELHLRLRMTPRLAVRSE
jgi:hypothetical protein